MHNILSKVISLYQPYASLMAWGRKKHETRSWPTKYCGPVAIHATKNTPKWCCNLINNPFFRSALYAEGFAAIEDLPTGHIIGYGDITWSKPTHELDHLKIDNPIEHAFGDYSTGRSAWGFTLQGALDKPIPAKGGQGYWYYGLDVSEPLFSGAKFSFDGKHRYMLWRRWTVASPRKSLRFILFIALNPSKAGQDRNDPTIRRCIKLAFKWGYDGMYFANLYSLISPDPKFMEANKDLDWSTNDKALSYLIDKADTIVLAWGGYKFIGQRVKAVQKLLRGHEHKLHCLAKNQNGSPMHPSPRNTIQIDHLIKY